MRKHNIILYISWQTLILLFFLKKVPCAGYKIRICKRFGVVQTQRSVIDFEKG